MKLIRYIKDIVVGLWRLGQGMYISLLNFVRPKVTEQYPENRGKKEYFERFRALLAMPHDEGNHHKCTACGICANNCPNGTIKVTAKMEPDPATGRDKRVLDRYEYDLGSCIFCALCTQSCPFGAIEFSNHFEHSVFMKGRLSKTLNRPGSSLAPKPAKESAGEEGGAKTVTETKAATEPKTAAEAKTTAAAGQPAAAASEDNESVTKPKTA